jgi:hypothetical protein
MQLGHLLTRSGLTCLEVSLMVSPGFLCLSVCSYLVFSAIYYEVCCLYVATNFCCIPLFCPILGLYLVRLQILCFQMEKILLKLIQGNVCRLLQILQRHSVINYIPTFQISFMIRHKTQYGISRIGPLKLRKKYIINKCIGTPPCVPTKLSLI